MSRHQKQVDVFYREPEEDGNSMTYRRIWTERVPLIGEQIELAARLCQKDRDEGKPERERREYIREAARELGLLKEPSRSKASV